MWKVFRGDVESGEAVEAFGAICVDKVTAGRLGLTKLSASRGDLGQGDLYGIEDLLCANGESGAVASRAEKAYHLPAAAPVAEEPAQ